MAFWAEYGLFLAKTLTVGTTTVVVIGMAAALTGRAQAGSSGKLEVRDLSKRYQQQREQVQQLLEQDTPRTWRERLPWAKKAKTTATKPEPLKERLFVLRFDGDLQASAVDSLRHEVDAILGVAQAGDEVLLRLESAGGVVNGYGLAAAQLQRLKAADLRLTICVDKVAASGGYLMACVGERILASPFAIIGSIGVVAQLPNFNRWLRKHEIDFELHTAGQFKRTLTMFGENTEQGREKFRQDLESIHQQFSQFVAEQRPKLVIEHVNTGEFWLGQQALALGLVDELRTSDDYLLERSRNARLIALRYRPHRSLRQRLAHSALQLWEQFQPRSHG